MCYVWLMLICNKYLSYIVISAIEVNCYLRFNPIESQICLRFRKGTMVKEGTGRWRREKAPKGEADKRHRLKQMPEERQQSILSGTDLTKLFQTFWCLERVRKCGSVNQSP